jgi:hypothetical protein
MSRRHFGPQHLKNGYAEMGGAMGRPYYKGAANRSIAESIARARETAARMLKAQGKKKS